jgi:hypothetical protein
MSTMVLESELMSQELLYVDNYCLSCQHTSLRRPQPSAATHRTLAEVQQILLILIKRVKIASSPSTANHTGDLL